ncbi:MAG TPA: class I SAM-dependent methyltransferase [Anaerovoracaceae bacterium]|nr:class I SAM-dependent methyltransferase [Anaerovoracaceae bacterium]
MEKNIDFGHVADIYDYYTNVDFDVDFFKTLCKGHKNILELMCGTGRVSVPLIKEGFLLTCVDYSEEMLDIFRKKVNGSENVKIVCQDICELNLDDQFDLIIIPSNSISEIIDKEKRRKAFRKIYKHLAPDGIFFCTLYNPEYRIQQADGNIRYLGKYNLDNNKTLVVTYYNVFASEWGIISGTQFYEIYDKNRLVEKRCLDINFSIITKAEICKMASEEGFSLKAIYGDYEPYHYDEQSTFMNLLFKKKRRCR